MEAEFRAQLTPSGYVHEIMAEFGAQDTGVFNKDKVDLAMTHMNYAYNELSYLQKEKAQRLGTMPDMLNYHGRAPINPFRTMGVD